jgi:hypothetical protein
MIAVTVSLPAPARTVVVAPEVTLIVSSPLPPSIRDVRPPPCR